jgi:hypothetical protein
MLPTEHPLPCEGQAAAMATALQTSEMGIFLQGLEISPIWVTKKGKHHSKQTKYSSE